MNWSAKRLSISLPISYKKYVLKILRGEKVYHLATEGTSVLEQGDRLVREEAIRFGGLHRHAVIELLDEFLADFFRILDVDLLRDLTAIRVLDS